jgi:hypothetical protein
MHLQVGDIELSQPLLDVAARALPEAFQFSEHAPACLRLRFRHKVPNRIIRNRTIRMMGPVRVPKRAGRHRPKLGL